MAGYVHRRGRTLAGLACAMAAIFGLALGARAQSSPTGFTYQGRLTRNSQSFTGSADLSFTLFDAQNGGNALAGPLALNAVPVQNGLFTVMLDFGIPVGGAGERWLEISAGAPAGTDPAVLAARQPVTPAPVSTISFAVPVYSGQPIAPFKGAIRFNDALSDFQGFNGYFWTSLTGKPNPAYATTNFNASDTFTVPAGVTQVFVEVWGAGGGGGGCVNVSPNCASAGPSAGGIGGSGGYAAGLLSVTPGEALTVTVGTGGAAGINTVNLLTGAFPGGDGGASSVSRGPEVLVSATGGQGGGGGIWTEIAAQSCAGGPNDRVDVGGCVGGVGVGGSIVNTQGASGSLVYRASSCLGCCYPGLTATAHGATGSYLASIGLPGAVSFGAGGGGTGAHAASNPPSCVSAAGAGFGNRGEVRFYWTTGP